MNLSIPLLCEPLKMKSLGTSADSIQPHKMAKADVVEPKTNDVILPSGHLPSLPLPPRTTKVPQSCDARFELPENFQPKPYHVVIGRGKASKTALGNQRLIKIATSFLPRYKQCKSKIQKTAIVTEIVQAVEDSCPPAAIVNEGAFIKFISGRWWKVDGHAGKFNPKRCYGIFTLFFSFFLFKKYGNLMPNVVVCTIRYYLNFVLQLEKRLDIA